VTTSKAMKMEQAILGLIPSTDKYLRIERSKRILK